MEVQAVKGDADVDDEEQCGLFCVVAHPKDFGITETLALSCVADFPGVDKFEVEVEGAALTDPSFLTFFSFVHTFSWTTTFCLVLSMLCVT